MTWVRITHYCLTFGTHCPLYTGTIHNGSRLMHFVSNNPAVFCFFQANPILTQGTPTGTIETVPGFEPAFKATVNFGADWLSFDPDGAHGRIDLRGMARYDQPNCA